MVEGMTILSQATEPTVWVIALVLFGFIAFICFIAWIADGEGYLFMFAVLTMAASGLIATGMPLEETIIKATITENASWQQITEKYKFLSERDGVYVFKEIASKQEEKKDGHHCCCCGK